MPPQNTLDAVDQKHLETGLSYNQDKAMDAVHQEEFMEPFNAEDWDAY
jgi:hypothetical protein